MNDYNNSYLRKYPEKKKYSNNFLGDLRSYTEFKNALGHQESTNNYKSKNSSGCIGRYQFCPGTYERISKKVTGTVIPKKDFLNNGSLQEKFFDELIRTNIQDIGLKNFGSYLALLKYRLGSGITASGMIAGMHLGGARGVENLAKKGIDRKDGNGTPISSYVKRFSGYEIPFLNEGSYTSDNTVYTPIKQKNKGRDKTNSSSGSLDINFSEIIPYIGYGLLAVTGIILISAARS